MTDFATTPIQTPNHTTFYFLLILTFLAVLSLPPAPQLLLLYGQADTVAVQGLKEGHICPLGATNA
jgi:hypothetical protein